MENDENENPKAYEEEYAQLREDFDCDVEFTADIDEEIDNVEIVYDEREK